MKVATKSSREFEAIPYENRGTQETYFLTGAIYGLMLEFEDETA